MAALVAPSTLLAFLCVKVSISFTALLIAFRPPACCCEEMEISWITWLICEIFSVNPVICEMVNQVAFHVIGTDVTISFAAEAGQLQLNAFEPVMAFELLQSVRLLTSAAQIFRVKCIAGIAADAERCRRNLEASTANFTELVPALGYETASRLAKEMLASGKTWAEVKSNLAG